MMAHSLRISLRLKPKKGSGVIDLSEAPELERRPHYGGDHKL
jgi:hypothetical protein